jgi:hypothetical protein
MQRDPIALAVFEMGDKAILSNCHPGQDSFAALCIDLDQLAIDIIHSDIHQGAGMGWASLA